MSSDTNTPLPTPPFYPHRAEYKPCQQAINTSYTAQESFSCTIIYLASILAPIPLVSLSFMLTLKSVGPFIHFQLF